MFIHKTIETNEGEAEFKGDFSEEEVDFLIEHALRDLVQRRMIPFKIFKEEDACNMSLGDSGSTKQ